MSPSKEFKPLIYTSTKADARDADVFIHWPLTGKIVACFNFQVTPVTSHTLLRWFDMVVAWDIGLKPVLKKVEMEQRGLLEYYPRPLPSEEALADSHILEPGTYACFAGADSMDPPSDAAVHFQGQETSIMTLWERARRNKYNAGVRGRQQAYDEIIAIPSEVVDQVSLPRDQCIFTGATSDAPAGQDVVLSWFFPPYLRGEITTYAATREISLGDISWRSHFNLVPMRADVHQLWLQNAFSIDVADGHRIRIFSKDALDIGLPERLGNPNPEWDVYLTEHFRHTLVVQVIGGDIRVKYRWDAWDCGRR
ncbi:hypothetical protein VTO73DRAFT_2311 [Trametes versicolor]